MLAFINDHHESVIVAILTTIILTGGAGIFWASMHLIARSA